MALTAYARVKFFWGAVDIEVSGDPYHPDEKKSLGPDARVGNGVGVRRCQLVFTRVPPGTFSEDVAVMHFDFLNITGGEPDDTWTQTDFTTLETAIDSWFGQLAGGLTALLALKEYRWYRIGSGVTPPNPPVRVTTKNTPASGSQVALPPQCACTVSLHTAVRTSWGRTYIPGFTIGQITGHGVLANAVVDTIATASDGLVRAAAAADLAMVVIAQRFQSALTVEGIAVDNIVDIQRRRRWEHPTHRTQHNLQGRTTRTMEGGQAVDHHEEYSANSDNESPELVDAD